MAYQRGAGSLWIIPPLHRHIIQLSCCCCCCYCCCCCCCCCLIRMMESLRRSRCTKYRVEVRIEGCGKCVTSCFRNWFGTVEQRGGVDGTTTPTRRQCLLALIISFAPIPSSRFHEERVVVIFTTAYFVSQTCFNFDVRGKSNQIILMHKNSNEWVKKFWFAIPVVDRIFADFARNPLHGFLSVR